MTRYCFDASVLVIYITNDNPKSNIKQIMKNIESGKGTGLLSVVNLAEFHRAISRIFSEDKADMYVTWLRESKIEIISPSIELACLASTKKQKYASSSSPFAWGDAFCLATALEHKADFIITSDSEFKRIKEVPIIFD